MMSRGQEDVGRIQGTQLGLSSGQPSVANGHSAELNHVSSTSSSGAAARHTSGSARIRRDVRLLARYQTGSRCPH